MSAVLVGKIVIIRVKLFTARTLHLGLEVGVR